MHILPKISGVKAAVNSLLLAVLYAGIFLLQETGPGRPYIPREATHIAMGFHGYRHSVRSIYDVRLSSQPRQIRKTSGFAMVAILGAQLANLILVISRNSDEKLPVSRVNQNQHLRSRSLTPEDPFHSFS
jgi:hypothetical protein